MNVTDISGINLNQVTELYNTQTAGSVNNSDKTSFDSLFQSALNMVQETNQLSNAAEEEELKYAMGMSDSIHDLQVAQQKANVSLQYTVAVKNTAIEAYKSILNMQF